MFLDVEAGGAEVSCGGSSPVCILCTRPILPSLSRTLMPRGWFPDVRTFWTRPWTSRPVG